MTGVGVARGTTELGEMAIEVRSVNGRNLAVKMRLAPACQGLESSFEKRVRERLRRGNVTVVAEVTTPSVHDEPVVDAARARQAAEQLRTLAADLDFQAGPSLTDILAVPGVLLSATAATSKVSWEPPQQLAALFEEALSHLLDHRRQEGAATAVAIREQLKILDAERTAAAARVPSIVDDHRAKLIQRVGEFLDGQARQLEDQDVLRELAMFADRVDVSEELQRLEMHLEQANGLLDAGGEVGRKLEFLLQETLRETNTLGSKSPDAEITRTVVQMKSAIDKLKEQAANLE